MSDQGAYSSNSCPPAHRAGAPPSNPRWTANRAYNVLFKGESGLASDAQMTAFDDTWHWRESAEETYYNLMSSSSIEVARLVDALREFIGKNQMMAYLVMMTARLVELHRVLKHGRHC